MSDSVASLCDEKQFEEVYTETNHRLVNFLYYSFGDLEKARNFSQDAFIRLWKNCKEIAMEKAKGFLYTCLLYTSPSPRD